MLLFVPYTRIFFFCCCFSGNVTNIAAVRQPSSTCQWGRLLTVCCQRFTHQPIVFSLGLAMRSVSLFSSRAATLVSRVSRLGCSTLARACTPLTRLNLEKTRGCLQSTADPCSLPGISNFAITVYWSTSRHSFYYSMRNAYSDLIENKMGAVFPRIIAGGNYFFFRTKRGRLFEGGNYFKQCSLERSCPKYFVLLCH